VESVLTRRGLDLILYEVDGEAALHRFLSESAPYRKRTDGLILAELTVPRDLIPGLVASRVMIATLGDCTEEFPSVCIDNEEAARLVVRHLISLGHEHIGLVGGQTDAPIHFDVPDLRLRGALSAMKDAGLSPIEAHLQTGGFTITGGYQAMNRMLDHAVAPTAVFAFSDEMAIGAMRAVRDHGMRVPEDVSVAGFDDHDVSWSLDLTTVAQPVVGLGESVAQLLLDRLENQAAPPPHLVYPVTLVPRESTGPAPLRLTPAHSSV
jgi:LacI family repressor for deo operon, udp, cdd, tsx, nupC, and nupG